jgi:hypothetical protein
MNTMIQTPRFSLLAAPLLALLLAGCGGGSSCLLGDALCNEKTPANVAPVARTASPQSALLGQTVVFDGSASSDANGDTLRYSWTWLSKPEGSTVELLKADEVRASFTADVPGVYAARLAVSDGKLSSDTSVVLVQVSYLNVAPIAVTGPAQTVVKGSQVTLDGIGSSDENNDRLTYKWQLIAMPAGSTAELSDVASARPTFTANVSGVYVASLIVSDGKLSSQLASVVVTAVDANAPPVADAGANQSVLVGAEVKIDGLASFDPNRDELQYKWTLITAPTGSSADLAPKNVVRTSFTADLPGIYVVGLTVSDKQLFSEMAVVTITAANGNAAPTAVAGPAQSVLKGAVVNLDGSGSTDPNGDLLKYEWTLVSVPAGSTASLSDRTVAKPSFTANASGVYVLSLVVSDAQLSSAPSLMSVTASAANVPPVANAGPEQTVRVGNLVTLNGSGSTDANGDVLSYQWTWTTNPGNVNLLLPLTANPSFTPTVAGIYVLTLTVDDRKGGTHTSRVLINVE